MDRARSLIDVAFSGYGTDRLRAFQRNSAAPRRQRPTSNHTVPEAPPRLSPHFGWHSDVPDDVSFNTRFIWSDEDGAFFVFPETQSFLSRRRARSENYRRLDEELEEERAQSLERKKVLEEYEQREKGKPTSETRSRSGLFRTFDMNAFSDDDDEGAAAKPASTSGADPSNVPPIFPRHTVLNDATALQPYLDSAEYIASLCGKALPDLKYGIIVVPRGEEEMFLRDPEDSMTPTFKTEILDKSRAMRKQQLAELREEELEYLMKGNRGQSSCGATDNPLRSSERRMRQSLEGPGIPTTEPLPSVEPPTPPRQYSRRWIRDGPDDPAPSLAPRQDFNWRPLDGSGDFAASPVDLPLRSPWQPPPDRVHTRLQQENATDSYSLPSFLIWRRQDQSTDRNSNDMSQNKNVTRRRSRSAYRRGSAAPPSRIRVVQTFLPKWRLYPSEYSSVLAPNGIPSPGARSDEDIDRRDHEQPPSRNAEHILDRDPGRYSGRSVDGVRPWNSRSELPIRGDASDPGVSLYSSAFSIGRGTGKRGITPYDPTRQTRRRYHLSPRSTRDAGRRSWSPRRFAAELRRAPLRSSSDDGDTYDGHRWERLRGSNIHGGFDAEFAKQLAELESLSDPNRLDSDLEALRRPIYLQLSSHAKDPEAPPTQPAESLPLRRTDQPTQETSPSTLDCSRQESPPVYAGPKSSPRLDAKEAAAPSQASDTLSPGALSALEMLLSQAQSPSKRRRRSFGAVLSKFRRKRHASPGEPLPDTGITRQLLLQLGDAVSALAAGELEENPGIDPRTWDAVQKAIRAS